MESLTMACPATVDKAFPEGQTTNATCGLSPSENCRNGLLVYCGLTASGMLLEDIMHSVSDVSHHSRAGMSQVSTPTLPVSQIACN